MTALTNSQKFEIQKQYQPIPGTASKLAAKYGVTVDVIKQIVKSKSSNLIDWKFRSDLLI